MRAGGDRSAPEQFTAMLLDQLSEDVADAVTAAPAHSPSSGRGSIAGFSVLRLQSEPLDSSDRSLVAVISAPARSTFPRPADRSILTIRRTAGEARFGGTELARESPQCDCFAL
jgi:hypothetical protein